MTIRHRLVVVALALAPATAAAVSCPTFEYAELKEMSLEDLLQARSDVTTQAFITMEPRRPDREGAERCNAERAKIDRMIKKRQDEG